MVWFRYKEYYDIIVEVKLICFGESDIVVRGFLGGFLELGIRGGVGY